MYPPILLYDGVCGLCNRFVQFVLRRDRNAVFRFASLQSALASGILTRHGTDASPLDTVYVVLNRDLPDERLLSRSDAVIFVLVLRELGGLARFSAYLLQLLPRFLREGCYNAIAHYRYRIFGRSELCTLPCDPDHSRFLDL
jgi:predicted DCC family thiol-disulfide oxidoreductase YuxK